MDEVSLKEEVFVLHRKTSMEWRVLVLLLFCSQGRGSHCGMHSHVARMKAVVVDVVSSLDVLLATSCRSLATCAAICLRDHRSVAFTVTRDTVSRGKIMLSPKKHLSDRGKHVWRVYNSVHEHACALIHIYTYKTSLYAYVLVHFFYSLSLTDAFWLLFSQTYTQTITHIFCLVRNKDLALVL